MITYKKHGLSWFCLKNFSENPGGLLNILSQVHAAEAVIIPDLPCSQCLLDRTHLGHRMVALRGTSCDVVVTQYTEYRKSALSLCSLYCIHSLTWSFFFVKYSEIWFFLFDFLFFFFCAIASLGIQNNFQYNCLLQMIQFKKLQKCSCKSWICYYCKVKFKPVKLFSARLWHHLWGIGLAGQSLPVETWVSCMHVAMFANWGSVFHCARLSHILKWDL